MTTTNALNINIPVAISKGGTNATSFTQTNGVVTYNGTSLVNYAGPQISSSAYASNTSQPAFNAYASGNLTSVTGNGVAYTVLWNDVAFDNTSAINTGTGIFTAPIAGNYLFTTWINVNNLSSNQTEGVIQLVTTAATYTIGRGNFWSMSELQTGVNNVAMAGAVMAAMSLNDTAKVVVTVFAGSQIVDISGTYGPSGFSGMLIC